MNTNEQGLSEKKIKRNSYEIEPNTKESKQLKQAPKPHSYGGQITEDME
ncbi:hypothetical protein [Alkalihalobacillus deserti]|nr:hypothetical protein [Alkalihalobacillus deserti]